MSSNPMTIKGRKVLVTGGSGFLGSHLVRSLSPDNTVTLLDRLPPPEPLSPSATFVQGDVSRSSTWEQFTAPFDYVFHFGSPSSIVEFKKDLVRHSGEALLGFLQVLEFCHRHAPTALVYPSSGTIYGAQRREGSEERRPSNIYGVVKYTHEMLADLYAREFRIRGLRIFMGYGPGEERKGEIASPVYLFLERMMRGESPEIWGDGTQARDIIFVDDVVDAIIAFSQHHGEPHETLDVGSGTSVSFLSILGEINRVLGTDIQPHFRPAPRDYVRSTVARPERLRNLLVRTPLPFEEGLERFVDYLRDLALASKKEGEDVLP